MKVKFKWEIISDQGVEDDYNITYRAKVKGGWLVLINSYTFTSNQFDPEQEEVSRVGTAMTFIPDVKHEWEIEI